MITAQNLNTPPTLITGEYCFRITKPDGSVWETGFVKNILTNIGLDRMIDGNVSTWGLYAYVGTGTSTPLATHLQLDAKIATSQTNPTRAVTNAGSPTYASTHTRTYTFAQGAVVGNITEAGIGRSTDGTNIESRVLIVDNNGTPTALTLVAIDQLTLIYRLTITPPTADFTGAFLLGSTPYTYTARLASAASFAGSTDHVTANIANASTAFLSTQTALSPITGSLTNNSTNAIVTLQPYVAGSFQRVSKLTWGISVGNGSSTGMNILYASNTITYQLLFNQPIVKLNTQVLELNTTQSWARA